MNWLINLIFGGLVKLVPGLADSVFRHMEAKANSETERMKIASIEQQRLTTEQAATIRTAMGFRIFWVAWAMIAVPFAAWLGMGFADSLFNGALPDVAKLPPQLKGYADIVMANIFVSGGVVAGIQGGARAVSNAVVTHAITRTPPETTPKGRKQYRLPQGGK